MSQKNMKRYKKAVKSELDNNIEDIALKSISKYMEFVRSQSFINRLKFVMSILFVGKSK